MNDETTPPTIAHGFDLDGWPDPDRRGIPLNPNKNGFHWFVYDGDPSCEPVVFEWNNAIRQWYMTNNAPTTPAELVKRGWRYLGPAKTPSQIREMVEVITQAVSDPADAELIRYRFG